MRRRTRFFLLAGCAVIVFLETPAMLAGLAAGWRGPYAGCGLDAAELVTAGARTLAAAAQQSQPLALARR